MAAVQRRYLPNAVLAWGEAGTGPLWEERRAGLAYVCRNYTCQAPTDALDVLETHLSTA